MHRYASIMQNYKKYSNPTTQTKQKNKKTNFPPHKSLHKNHIFFPIPTATLKQTSSKKTATLTPPTRKVHKATKTHLVTDAYSRKVVGWCLSPTLQAQYTLNALREAIDQAQGYDLSKLIHHSDRGVQYCCNDYTNELNSYSINISMTEDYKPTDNGIAERVNGIIKTEKLYHQPLYKSIEEARKEIGRFIDFYNNRRPHMSIDYQTPAQVHHQSGPQKKQWKSYQPATSTFLGQ